MSVLQEFGGYYNEKRLHQGLGQHIPVMSVSPSPNEGPVRCRNVLGGIIHDYYRLAA